MTDEEGYDSILPKPKVDSRTRVLIALTTEEVTDVCDGLRGFSGVCENYGDPERAAEARRLADTIEAQMRGRDDHAS